MDEILDPTITIKAIGRQWYWEYEYSDYISPELSFESYMIPTDNLEEGQLRLLEVDNRLILPSDTSIRVIVTAADVLHAWAVPSLGVKMDCVPGRLNQTSMYVKRNGVYYGQCSELCGVQHGFMPIVIEVVNINDYINWLKAYEIA
jgi:cytochrome c oxidase subunit 2